MLDLVVLLWIILIITCLLGALGAWILTERTNQLQARLTGLEARLAELEPVRCRVCGCTDAQACWPTCYWVEPDLCSSCAPAAATGLER